MRGRGPSRSWLNPDGMLAAMRTRTLSLFGALAVPFVAGALACAAAGRDAFSAEEEQDAVVDPFVAAHNEVRSAVQPPADPPLPPLEWSSSLAEVAQAWAERCAFEHSEGSFGENLAFFSGTASTARDVVAGWADEARFYDYERDSCAAAEECGHYTQLVWRGTQRVGCGAAECNIFGADGLFWVCNYDPPGNFIGQRPY